MTTQTKEEQFIREARHRIRTIANSNLNQFYRCNLATIHWKKFEELVAALYTLEFNHKVYFTRGTNDQGVDGLVKIRNELIIFQAKKYKGDVAPSVVRDLYGTMMHFHAKMGFIISTSDFGPGAYKFAENKNIKLINGQYLLGLLRRYGYNNFYIDFRKHTNSIREKRNSFRTSSDKPIQLTINVSKQSKYKSSLYKLNKDIDACIDSIERIKKRIQEEKEKNLKEKIQNPTSMEQNIVIEKKLEADPPVSIPSNEVKKHQENPNLSNNQRPNTDIKNFNQDIQEITDSIKNLTNRIQKEREKSAAELHPERAQKLTESKTIINNQLKSDSLSTLNSDIYKEPQFKPSSIKNKKPRIKFNRKKIIINLLVLAIICICLGSISIWLLLIAILYSTIRIYYRMKKRKK